MLDARYLSFLILFIKKFIKMFIKTVKRILNELFKDKNCSIANCKSWYFGFVLFIFGFFSRLAKLNFGSFQYISRLQNARECCSNRMRRALIPSHFLEKESKIVNNQFFFQSFASTLLKFKVFAHYQEFSVLLRPCKSEVLPTLVCSFVVFIIYNQKERSSTLFQHNFMVTS